MHTLVEIMPHFYTVKIFNKRMKQKLLIFISLIVVYGISNAQTFPDPMAVEIIPEDYGNPSKITIFTEGGNPYTNSGTVWESVASDFNGFQFFSTNSNNTYRGKIVPSGTGEIYLVASGTLTISGWTKTSYTASYRLSDTRTSLYIFKKSVNLGDTIPIPTNTNWAGLSPLAHTLTIKEIDPSTLALVKSSPVENEVCHNNLQKEIKLYFNKAVELASGELLLNETVVPLNYCRVEENVISIPVELEATSFANLNYTFTASTGCFREKDGTDFSEAITLNFKTSKTVAYPSNYAAKIDVFYKNVGSFNTRMDIYYPKNTNKTVPIIIRFHGGGWKSGLKEDYTNFNIYFNQGYALANVEYRLTGEAKAPAAVEDARAAMIYILHHAEELNIDKRKIILLGGSAGGHLALTAGYLQNNRIYDSNTAPYTDEIKVLAVVNKYGIAMPSDLMTYSSLLEWLGPNVNNKEFIKSLSPVDLVSTNTPATYIVHGDADPTVPYKQSLLLQAALQEASLKHQFTTIPGGGHGGFSSAYNAQIDKEVILFINDAIRSVDDETEELVNYDWLLAPAINILGNIVKVVGRDADKFTNITIDDAIGNDLSAIEVDEDVKLKAIDGKGQEIRLVIEGDVK